uniref:Uncharacterized protein n=1 Tax=Arundo donax TaxID=35708 RepID=A0A0A8ZCU3_ARUDO
MIHMVLLFNCAIRNIHRVNINSV